MSKPRRAQASKFKIDRVTPEWSASGNCPACGKKIYDSKKAARAAARIRHPNDRMSPYQCRSKDPAKPNPAPWHLGHLMDEIRRGDLDRYTMYEIHKIPPRQKRTSTNGTDYLRSLSKNSK